MKLKYSSYYYYHYYKTDQGCGPIQRPTLQSIKWQEEKSKDTFLRGRSSQIHSAHMRLQHEKCICRSMGPLDFWASPLSCPVVVCFNKWNSVPGENGGPGLGGEQGSRSLYIIPASWVFNQATASAPTAASLCSPQLTFCLEKLLPYNCGPCYCLTPWASASAKSVLRCGCEPLSSIWSCFGGLVTDTQSPNTL